MTIIKIIWKEKQQILPLEKLEPKNDSANQFSVSQLIS